MLSREGCEGRRKRLWEALGGSCDFVLVAQGESVNWLTGFWPSPFEFRGNEGGGLILMDGERACLVSDNLLARDLEEAHVEERVARVWYEGKRSAPPRREMLARTAAEAVKRFSGGKRVGFEAGALPAGVFEEVVKARGDVEWVEVGGLIRELRRVKDEDELALMRRAIQGTDAGLLAARKEARAGMTEFEIFRVVQEAAMSAVGEAAIVYGDFLSGPRCEQRGGPPTNRMIEEGELLLLDFSVVVRGYRGDVASTFVVGDVEAGREVRELFDCCLEAMLAGEALLKPGIPAREVDRAARGVLAKRGLDVHSPSHVGHGLGLGHPEPPYIVPESVDTLQRGEVVTLEPGVYVPGVAGIRVEHNYLIGEEGPERLSRHDLALR